MDLLEGDRTLEELVAAVEGAVAGASGGVEGEIAAFLEDLLAIDVVELIRPGPRASPQPVRE